MSCAMCKWDNTKIKCLLAPLVFAGILITHERARAALWAKERVVPLIIMQFESKERQRDARRHRASRHTLSFACVSQIKWARCSYTRSRRREPARFSGVIIQLKSCFALVADEDIHLPHCEIIQGCSLKCKHGLKKNERGCFVCGCQKIDGEYFSTGRDNFSHLMWCREWEPEKNEFPSDYARNSHTANLQSYRRRACSLWNSRAVLSSIGYAK